MKLVLDWAYPFLTSWKQLLGKCCWAMSTHSLIVILYFLELCEKKTIVGVKVTSSLVYHRKTRRISVVNYFTSSLLVMVLLLFFLF